MVVCYSKTNQMGKHFQSRSLFFLRRTIILLETIYRSPCSYMSQYKVAGLNPSKLFLHQSFIHALNVILMFWFIYRLKQTDVRHAGGTCLGSPCTWNLLARVGRTKGCVIVFSFFTGLITYINYNEGAINAFGLLFTFLLFPGFVL